MIKYSIINKRGKSKEFDFLHFWEEGYDYVDARFCNLSVTKDRALYNYKKYLYKLWYLNPDITEEQMIDDGMKMMYHKTNSGTGILILQEELYKIVMDVFHNDLPKNISELVKDTARIEWKKDISGLLEVSEEEFRELYGFDSDYREYVRNKKVKESLKCINMVKRKAIKEKIIDTIMIIKQENYGVCSILDVSEILGISYKTAKKHYEDYLDDVSVENYSLVSNKNNLAKDNSLSTLNECSKLLIKAGEAVTKQRLHKATGMSRITINKYWDRIYKSSCK